MNTMQAYMLPFGKHRGKDLNTVPIQYLTWLASSCRRSSGLFRAIENELQSRGHRLELPPESADPPVCNRCGSPDLDLTWQVLRDGRRMILGRCSQCNAARFLPQTKVNIEMADKGTA
jgi:Putative quorum-sensing-regulated virulence factor